MREIVHIQAGQCGNQIGSKVRFYNWKNLLSFKYCLKMNQLQFEEFFFSLGGYFR